MIDDERVRRRGSILMAEDDPDDQLMAREALEESRLADDRIVVE